MKLNKWITLSALFGCSVAFAQNAQDVRTLDIIVRDFQPNHPDFENFSEESVQHLDQIYNYQVGNAAMKFFGYDEDWYMRADQYHKTCGNMNTINMGYGAKIGTDGLPMTPNMSLPGYLQGTSVTNQTLEYGECSDKNNGNTLRGYKNAQPGVSGYKCPNGGTNWANPVIYTPGMVYPYLEFTPAAGSDKIDMLYDVHIKKQTEACDNQFFDQWFADVPSINKTVYTTMDIGKDPQGSKYYIYDYNYNNGGYSPLDSIDPVSRERVGDKPCNAKIQPNQVCEQFGAQTLSIFCPPYAYEWADKQYDYMGQNTAQLCKDWLLLGGPRSINADGAGNSAAYVAAARNGKLGMQHLRNYAFTMMGYASFKYKKSNQYNAAGQLDPEVFEFAGDDDMWIFVDGVLVVDLGGTHLSAPGKVNIITLAANNHGCHVGEPLSTYSNCAGASDATGWADDTWHHLHFFYADRQSDGSNIYIRTSLAELAPSRYGQPTVNNVVVKVDDKGVSHNSMFMNVPLADSSLNMILANKDAVPPMVVLRDVTVLGTDGKPLKTLAGTDSVVTMVYGFYVTSITGPTDKGADGQMYQFEGKVMGIDANGNVVEVPGGLLGGDRIAFNVPWSQGLEDDGNSGYPKYVWDQLMQWSHKSTYYIASVSGKHVEGFDEREKWGQISYTAQAIVAVIPDDPAYDRPDFSNEAQTLSDLADRSEDGKLPADMTADLVLTPIPAVAGVDPIKWAKDNADKLTGSPRQGNTAYAPGTSVVYGAGQGTNSTLCYSNDASTIPGKKSNESCTQWSFPTTQPFHVNIRVFDHLGHFVNQYNKRVTGDDFKKALAGKSSAYDKIETVPAIGCTNQMYGSDPSSATGAMLATIKMYPVTEKGRLLATGPYIYQMTVVMDQFEYCYKSYGNKLTDMTMPFMRTTETIRRGYRRTPKK